MSKSKSMKKFPYDKLHELVDNERKKKEGKSWTILSIILFIFFSACSILLLFVSSNPLERAAFAFGFGAIIIVTLKVLMLWIEDLSRDIDNHQYIHLIMQDFIAKSDIFTKLEIDNLDRRADISKGSGQMRTLLPVLSITLLGSFISSPLIPDQALSLIITGSALALILVLLRVLERTNTDEIIQHAIAEHRNNQQKAQVIKRATIQVVKQRESAALRMLYRHGTPIYQRPSQPSVASTNGVGANDEALQRPSNER
ncbi:MAG: hypothetical protein AAGF95_10545 [Chloroflexota bacterium]